MWNIVLFWGLCAAMKTKITDTNFLVNKWFVSGETNTFKSADKVFSIWCEDMWWFVCHIQVSVVSVQIHRGHSLGLKESDWNQICKLCRLGIHLKLCFIQYAWISANVWAVKLPLWQNTSGGFSDEALCFRADFLCMDSGHRVEEISQRTEPWRRRFYLE